MKDLYKPSEFAAMPNPKIRLVGLGLLLIATFGCGLFSSKQEAPLHDRLGEHISQAQQAQQHAADVWDRVLFGETVNCGEIISVPEPFFLSQKEADQFPESVVIRDALNAALAQLTHAANLWEQECQLDRATIPLDMVRQAEDALQTARDLLNQSASAWAVWQA